MNAGAAIEAVRAADAQGKTLVVHPADIPAVRSAMKRLGVRKLRVNAKHSAPRDASPGNLWGRRPGLGDDGDIPPATIGTDLKSYTNQPHDGTPLAEWSSHGDQAHAALYGELRSLFGEPMGVRHAASNLGALSEMSGKPVEMQFVTPADLVRFTEEAGLRSYYGESVGIRPSAYALGGFFDDIKIGKDALAVVKSITNSFRNPRALTFDGFFAGMVKKGYKSAEIAGAVKLVLPFLPAGVSQYLMSKSPAGPAIPPPPPGSSAGTTTTTTKKHERSWLERLFGK